MSDSAKRCTKTSIALTSVKRLAGAVSGEADVQRSNNPQHNSNHAQTPRSTTIGSPDYATPRAPQSSTLDFRTFTEGLLEPFTYSHRVSGPSIPRQQLSTRASLASSKRCGSFGHNDIISSASISQSRPDSKKPEALASSLRYLETTTSCVKLVGPLPSDIDPEILHRRLSDLTDAETDTTSARYGLTVLDRRISSDEDLSGIIKALEVTSLNDIKQHNPGVQNVPCSDGSRTTTTNSSPRDSSSTLGTSHTSSNAASWTISGRRATHSSSGSSDDFPDEDQDPMDPSRGEETAGTVSYPSGLACPYWVANHVLHRECGTLKLANIPALKQHLKRRHALPDYYCSKCFKIAKTHIAIHSHEPDCNNIQINDPYWNRMSRSVQKQIECKARIPNIFKAWNRIYQILFPDDSRTLKSPFMEDIPNPESVAVLVDVFQYLLSERLLSMQDLRERLLKVSPSQRVTTMVMQEALEQMGSKSDVELYFDIGYYLHTECFS